MFCWIAFLVFFPLVFASPLLDRSTGVDCSQWGVMLSGSYSLLTNLWGQNDATSGSQCSTLTSVDGDTVKWLTKWNWDGSGIKSYSNVRLDVGINQPLSAITSMQSTWKWSYSDTNLAVADVCYDFFTSSTPGGSNEVELMVWLANINAGPISYHYNKDGQAVPIRSNLSLDGHTWDLYAGSNGHNDVYSFLPCDGNISSFSGDLYRFFSYLIQAGRLSDSQYLVTAEAGTEVTSGSATFQTHEYSLSIDTD